LASDFILLPLAKNCIGIWILTNNRVNSAQKTTDLHFFFTHSTATKNASIVSLFRWFAIKITKIIIQANSLWNNLFETQYHRKVYIFPSSKSADKDTTQFTAQLKLLNDVLNS
jgi:hypothetical protein